MKSNYERKRLENVSMRKKRIINFAEEKSLFLTLTQTNKEKKLFEFLLEMKWVNG
jgi:hypothetical protein